MGEAHTISDNHIITKLSVNAALSDLDNYKCEFQLNDGVCEIYTQIKFTCKLSQGTGYVPTYTRRNLDRRDDICLSSMYLFLNQNFTQIYTNI